MQRKALESGEETIRDIVSGLEVIQVTGRVNDSNITELAIYVVPRFEEIDLEQTKIDIGDTRRKVILSYGGAFNDTLSNGLFDTLEINSSSSFGIVVIRDRDGSCRASSPIINDEDMVALIINTSACFDGGIGTRTLIRGYVYPEFGIPGQIYFTSPPVFVDEIVNLA
jgi:flagellin FlaB